MSAIASSSTICSTTSETPSKTPIYVYTTPRMFGKYHVVEPSCIAEMYAAFKTHGVAHSRIVEIPDPSYFQRLEKESEGVVSLLGGHAHFQSNTLKGKPADAITKFVERGGGWFGSCAGAITASQQLTRRAPIWLTFSDGLLNLLPIHAIHPINFPAEKQRVGACVIPILDEEGGQFPSIWNEGVFFQILDTDYKSFKVEARYADVTDEPIAAISGTYGKGKVSLIAFHPESDLPTTSKSLENKEEKEPPSASASAVPTALHPKDKFLARQFKKVGIL